jgi:hypothetical protein
MSVTLLHFTKTAEAVADILLHGFAYVAHPTKVAPFALPSIPIGDREPQQFGMICFRAEYPGERSVDHRKKYGSFAIVIDEVWARSEGAQPVLYIARDGSVTAATKSLMSAAAAKIRSEADRDSGNKLWMMAYSNQQLAGVFGATEWAGLLEVYQFLAPAEDEWEREWRIVNKSPHSGIPKTGLEAVSRLTTGGGWATYDSLKISRSAVLRFVAPQGCSSKLRSILPSDYRQVSITEEPL